MLSTEAVPPLMLSYSSIVHVKGSLGDKGLFSSANFSK